MKTTITRVAIPAHIYIAVESPEDATDEQIIAIAKARVNEIACDDGVPLRQFQSEEHAIAYVNDEVPATIEDRAW